MSTIRWLVAVATWMVLLCELKRAHGVSCWAEYNADTGTCGMLMTDNVTMEECCSKPFDLIYWAEMNEISPGDMFKYDAIYGGIPDCHRCERTCETKTCSEGRKCVMKGGQPRCVCKPDCSQNNSTHKGAVCATNNMQYKSLCALRKVKCRQQDLYELDVAYYGPCQNSCDSVQCLDNKCCVEDQHGKPHCVSYEAISCPGPFRDEFVCGADNVTYETTCQLRRTSCSRGSIMPVKHEGKCEGLTSCDDTVCVNNKQCFWDTPANTSRCILCNYTCSGWADEVSVCASDGETYDSWCQMQDTICQTGVYLELVSWGPCDPDGNSSYGISDPGSGEYRGYNMIHFTPSSKQVLSELRSSMYRNQERDDNTTTTTEPVLTTTPTPHHTPSSQGATTGVAGFLHGLANMGSDHEDDPN